MRRYLECLVVFLSVSGLSTLSIVSEHVGCGGRLERALDALRREKSRRSRIAVTEEVEETAEHREDLTSAPVQMIVRGISVKLPTVLASYGRWARVESCTFEPVNGSLGTRLSLEEMSVSGMVVFVSRGEHQPQLRDKCEMTLRMRGAGIELLTSPVSRRPGQMRIRTESSFTEPRFVSIYAYDCEPSRFDEWIERQGVGLTFRRRRRRRRRCFSSSDEQRTPGPEKNTLLPSPPSSEQLETLAEPRRATATKPSGREFSESKRENDLNQGVWQSKERILREVEEVFLRAASRALSSYIERQVHPAIKETLMLSMGYTVSYG